MYPFSELPIFPPSRPWLELYQSDPLLAIAAPLLTGFLFSVFLSFASAFSSRIERAFYSKGRKGIARKWSYIFRARSACDHCQKPIPFLYLTPAAGYLLTKGRCQSCGGSISARHPIEEGAAFLYGALLFFWQPQLQYVAMGLLFLIPCYLVAYIDANYFLIPTEATFSILVLALAELVVLGFNPAMVRVALGVAVIWFFIFWLLNRLAPEKLGFGDVYLVFALCVGTPFPLSIALPSAASLLGVVYVFLKRGPKESLRQVKVPLGLFLCIAFFILRLFPSAMM